MRNDIDGLQSKRETDMRDISPEQRHELLEERAGKRTVYRAVYRGYRTDYNDSVKLYFEGVTDTSGTRLLTVAFFTRSEQWEALDLEAGDTVQFTARLERWKIPGSLSYGPNRREPYRLTHPTNVSLIESGVPPEQRRKKPSKEQIVAERQGWADDDYARLKQSIRQGTRLLTALPDDVLDGLIRAIADHQNMSDVVSGTQEQVDAAATQMVRAASRNWEAQHGEEHLGHYEQPESFEALGVVAEVLGYLTEKHVPEERMRALYERDGIEVEY